VIEVDAPTRLVVEDAIVEDDGTTKRRQFNDSNGDRHRGGGRHDADDLTTHFDSLEGMEQAIAMGAAEGMKACMYQIDAVLAEVAA